MKVKYFLAFLMIFSVVSYPVRANEKVQKDLVKIKQQLTKEKEKKKQLEQQDKKAKEILKETDKKLLGVSTNIKESEKKISDLDSKMNFLIKQQSNYSDDMKRIQKEMSQTLGILQMYSLTPQAILFEGSGSISEQLTSMYALESSVKINDDKMKQFFSLVKKIEQNQEEISKTKSNLSKNQKEMTKRQENMKKILNEQSKKLEKIQTQKKNIDSNINKLAKQSKNLEDFLRKALTKQSSTTRYQKYTGSVPTLGKSPLPAKGPIIQEFGKTNENGVISDGIKIRTVSGATTISPHNGIVIFADYFKGYNKLVIIEHNKNFHTIIANLGEIYVQEGQNVSVGSPIGEINQNRILYLEIRYKNKPANPRNYFVVN